MSARWVATCASLVCFLLVLQPAAGASDVTRGEQVCTYSDPDFGAHTHPLDIDRVTVSRSTANVLAFHMTFVDSPPLRHDMGFQVAIDGDRDRSTGDKDGDEYYFAYVVGGPAPNPILEVWKGGAWHETRAASLSFSEAGGGVTFRISAAALGNAHAFDFWMLAGTDWSSDHSDLDQAPQREHVLVSPTTGKWSFPSCALIPAPGGSNSGLGWSDIVRTLAMFGALVLVALLVVYTARAISRRRSMNAPPSGQSLAQARAQLDRGDRRGALKNLDRALAGALAERNVPVLEQTLDLAREVYEGTRGKQQYQAGRIAYSAKQGIDLITGEASSAQR